MQQTNEAHAQRSAWQGRSTIELLREVASKATVLAKKEVELARTELQNDFAAELATVKTFAVAAVAALLTLNMLLIATVFALTAYMPGWLAALGIAGITLVVAAVFAGIAWQHHVSRPLDRTQKTIKEDLQWAKEQLA